MPSHKAVGFLLGKCVFVGLEQPLTIFLKQYLLGVATLGRSTNTQTFGYDRLAVGTAMKWWIITVL